MAVFGGWSALARRFPHPAHAAAGERATGMLMIRDRWNGSVAVHADADGLAIAPAPLMAIGHRTMLLPWSAIVPRLHTASPVIASTHIEVDGVPVAVFGKAAAYIERTLTARSIAMSP